jgi:hypothetical protein
MSNVHLLCYIRRDWLTSWKLDSLKRGTRNNPVLAYGSNDPNFARFAKRGNVLWVVGAHRDGPPSLEAKIEISGVLDKDKEWACEVRGSLGGSAFFGLNDASGELMQLVFRNNTSTWSLRDNYLAKKWRYSFGRSLQTPRRLAPPGDRINRRRSPGAAPLERLALRAMNRSVFISWKHDDNKGDRRRFIKALTVELAKRGFAVWWDKTAMTNVGVINEYSAGEREEMLGRLLRQGLARTTAVLALWTERYGIPTAGGSNWTRDEWHGRQGAARIAMTSEAFVRKSRMADPDRIVRMPQNPNPEEAVRAARRFEQAYDSLRGRSRELGSSANT